MEKIRRVVGFLVKKEFPYWFLLGALVSLAMSSGAFSSGRITGDEGSYLFQAGNFLDGRLRRDPAGLEPLLAHDIIILDAEHGWLSRYAPGHPLWLAPGVALAWPHLMTAAGLGFSLALAAGMGRRLGLPSPLLPLLLLCSPFVWLMYGTLLSHTSGMLAVWVLLYGHVRWRSGEGAGWAMLAGAGWAFLFLNRTWTGLLVALPFAVESLWYLWKGRRERKVWAGTLCFAGMAALGVAGFMAYNAATTGDPTLSTFLLYEESEGLGFGPRRTQGGAEFQVEHSLTRGLGFLADNLRGMNRWLFGWTGGGLALFGLILVGWRRCRTPLYLSAAALVAVGYVAFWFPGIPDVGPLYLFETLPFVLTAGAFGVNRVMAWSRRRIPRAGWAWAGAAGLSCLAAFAFGRERMRDIRNRHARHWRAEKMLDALPGRNVVFLDPGLRTDRNLYTYLSLNDRGWDSRNLRLRVGVDQAPLAPRAFPDRDAWAMEFRDGDLALRKLEISGQPVALVRPVARTFGDMPVRDGARQASQERAEAGWMSWGWYGLLPPGDYACDFELEVENARPDHPVRVEVMADAGRHQLAENTLTSASGSVRLSFSLSRLRFVEPRVWYGGSGTARLARLHIHSLPRDSTP